MHLFLQKRILLLAVLLCTFGQFVSAQSQNALDIATKHIQENLQELSLTTTDVANYVISDNYVSKHNGVTHLYLLQTHEGIHVRNGLININILPNGEVLNMGNRFVADLRSRVNTTTPQLSAQEAVEKVITHFEVETEVPYTLKETERISDQEIIFEHYGIALEPIKAQLVFEPLANKTVRLAWAVELYEQDANDWWNARIDALTGEVLAYHNQVIKCSFGSPAEVCAEAHNHSHAHNTSAAAMLDDEVSNVYHVLPLFIESPNHGERVLVNNPANLDYSPFGWHDTNGQTGVEYTITRGNNVHAYQDIFSINTSSNDEPDGGDSLVFDFPFDPENDKPYTQVDAAVTNLFYWNNVIHDVWYSYGFDEPSGNFQQNNYGNGGQQNDAVQAECLDGSGTNNANFGTGGDGSGGRMQMYFWGSGQPGGEQGGFLTANAPEGVAGDYEFSAAAFGGDIPGSDNPIIADVVLADDGDGTTSDACQELVNADDVDGKVAMIDRGVCEFGAKSVRAQNAGAIAVIICNNVADPATIVMGPGAAGNNVNIPVVMLSLEDCNTLKMGLPDLNISLFTDEGGIPLPGPTGIDGDFDNGIITHEYGHGISIRMTGGPSQGGCLSNEEQMGEGWSDWFGLVMTTTSADNPDEPRGIGTYAVDQATTGDGIRTHPYSRNFGVNPHTYSDINSESVPHGVGSVWCVMLWDLYWNLVDEYGFDDDIYDGNGGNNIAMQLVIDGIKLQACNPDFIDGRDAILAADMANYEGANQCLIWETFARRGLGVGANPGGSQNFDLPVLCSNALGIEKTGEATADAGDVITYTLNLANGLSEDFADLTVTDILPANTTYVDGSFTCGSATVSEGVVTFTVEQLPTLQITPCTYQVQIEPGNYSVISFEEGLENGIDDWAISNGTGTANWSVSTANPFDGTNSIFASNPENESDQYFSNAEPILLSGENPALGFWHSYDTEESWDGGIVELRIIGTGTWWDLGNYVIANGYNGNLQENEASALSGRAAFHGNSGGYIYTLFDLGLFGNNEVEIRFRFASDGFVGGDGWHVDNIQLYENIVSIENVACITDQDGEEMCDSAETTIFGILSATDDLDPRYRTAIFPNPTQDELTFRVFNAPTSDVDVNIYSVDGRLLQAGQYNANADFTINMVNYGAGVYFAEIISGDKQTIQKVVVK